MPAGLHRVVYPWPSSPKASVGQGRPIPSAASAEAGPAAQLILLHPRWRVITAHHRSGTRTESSSSSYFRSTLPGMSKSGVVDNLVQEELPASVDTPSRSHSRRNLWLLGILPAVVIVLGGCWLLFGHTGSGDPGGAILNQLTPVASALPHPSLVSDEPSRDSCDGMAGTAGWSDVVLQGSLEWSGSDNTLMTKITSGLVGLGWRRIPIPNPGEAMWKKRLTNGSVATAMLSRSPLGSPHWEFVAQAPPVGKAVSGC